MVCMETKTIKATALNIHVLKRTAAGRTEFPNRVDSPEHMRRCMKAGLVEISADGQTLLLTVAGRAAVGL